MVTMIRLSRILGVFVTLLRRVWAYSGIALCTCFLLYYLYGGISAFVLLVFAFTGILYHAEDNFLFYPELPTHSRVFVPLPSMYNLPYESVQVRTADGVGIHLFFISHQHTSNNEATDGQKLDKSTQQQQVDYKQLPTIVFFHGNAGNMGHRLQNCAGIFHNLHCNILLVEYRGYGLSEGNPTEEGLYLDAMASLDYLHSRNDINHSEIIVFGRSLGGAVAIDLASRPECAEKISCLIVENTFTSIPEMAKVLLSWRLLQYLPLMCYKNKFLSLYKVAHLRVPTLFVSGMADTLVPPRMMSELHARCGSERKQLLQLPLGTHNETWTLPGYYHSLGVFLYNLRLHKLTFAPANDTSSPVAVDVPTLLAKSARNVDAKLYKVQTL